MAQEQSNTQVPMQETVGETKDRGMFDVTGKKQEELQHNSQEENISSELGQKAHVSEENKPGLMEKLQSSSSSSSPEEEGLTEKIKDKITGDEAEAEKKESIVTPQKEEEKEGLMEKIKEKVTGHENKEEQMPVASPPPTPACSAGEGHEGEDKKKGTLEKIKEKIPGMHSKTEDDKKECENKRASH